MDIAFVKVWKGDLVGEFSMNCTSGCKMRFSTVLYVLLCIDLYFRSFIFTIGCQQNYLLLDIVYFLTKFKIPTTKGSQSRKSSKAAHSHRTWLS